MKNIEQTGDEVIDQLVTELFDDAQSLAREVRAALTPPTTTEPTRIVAYLRECALPLAECVLRNGATVNTLNPKRGARSGAKRGAKRGAR